MNQLPDDPFDVLRVSLLPSIGPTRGRALLSRFHSFQGMMKASVNEFKRLQGFQDGLAMQLFESCKDKQLLQRLEQIVQENQRIALNEGALLIPFYARDYPESLKQIYDPPLFLFQLGTYQPETDKKALAIVGTRSPSEYGRQATEYFSREITKRNITIVSGLALGVDTLAHQIALKHGGRTIAVLGSGLARIYPFTNKELAKRITEQGCLFSEHPMNAKPDAQKSNHQRSEYGNSCD
jgi:DNA processing protein